MLVKQICRACSSLRHNVKRYYHLDRYPVLASSADKQSSEFEVRNLKNRIMQHLLFDCFRPSSNNYLFLLLFLVYRLRCSSATLHMSYQSCRTITSECKVWSASCRQRSLASAKVEMRNQSRDTHQKGKC